jgi:hypothetical protein
MKQFKIRCSAISQIMADYEKTTAQDVQAAEKRLQDALELEAVKPNKTNIKAIETASKALEKIRLEYANETGLPKGAMTYVENWLKFEMYGKHKDVYNKYTDKGKSVESKAIQYLADFRGDAFYELNTKRFENDFLSGVPDIIEPSIIIDTKCSWDCYTFPFFETKLDPAYMWQMQGYMALTGRKNAVVAFVLMDAPEHLIERAAHLKALELGTELTEEIEEEVRKNMTYSNIKPYLRVKQFVVEYDPELIERIEKRVDDCRQYLNALLAALC